MEPTAQPDVVLYRDDILWVLLEGEKNPTDPSYPLRDQEISVPRSQIYKEVVKFDPFKSLDQKSLEGLLAHGDGWRRVRSAALDKFQQTLNESGLDPAKLEELKAQYEADKKETAKRQENWNKIAKLGGEPTEITKKAADEVITKELEKPIQNITEETKVFEPARQVVSSRSEDVKTTESLPTESRFIPQGKTEQNWRDIWREFSSNPLGSIKKLFTSTRAPEKIALATQETGEKVAETLGGSNWQAKVKIFLSNPVKAIAGFFKGAKTAGTAVKVGGAVAGGGELVAAGSGPIGWGLVALAAAKKIITSEQFKNLASRGAILVSAGIYFLWSHIPGLILGSLGGIIGAPFGVGAAASGFGAGFALGTGLQNIAASLLGGSGSVGGVGVGAGAASFTGSGVGFGTGVGVGTSGLSLASVGSAASSFGAMFTGTGITAIGGAAIFTSLTALLFSVGGVLAAVLQQPEEQPLGQSIESIFTLKKVATTPEVTDYDKGPTTLSYHLTIQPGVNPITVESITDKITRSNSSSWSQDVSVPISQTDYNVEISGPEFKDTYVYNLVTVKAKDNVTGKEETNTASTKVKIGSPAIQKDQPYGYPASGTITTLDAQVFDSDGHVHSSCFMNFSPCRWVKGGMDIAPRGGDPTVYSTVEGEVLKAQFIRSDNPIGDVGGVVYIKSGPYIVEYMHLDESVKNLSGSVNRGDPIGKVYGGTLGATSGPHVHYQVLFNNANLFFNDSTIMGTCANGKILPVQPVQYNGVSANTDQTCN